jgi:hypothetical protein
MVTYEVTALVELGSVSAYEQYMRDRHIPDLLATGHFVGVTFSKSAPGRYRIRYEAPSQAALDAYLRGHATGLRADFATHFPTGVQLSREVWEVLQSWPEQRAASL